MKRFILFFSAALLLGGSSLSALSEEIAKPQALPQAPVQGTQPAAPTAAEMQPAPLDQPIALIPDTLPESPQKDASEEGKKKASKDSRKKSKEPVVDYSADALNKRVRFREVKNQALRDDRIQAEMEAAQAAGTDKEKRAALKRYYNMLFDRMLKIDGSLKEEVDARRKTYTSRYDQTRVRPAGEPSEFDLKQDQ